MVRALALVSGVVAAATNCAFVFRAASGSRLDPVSSMISELEVPGQPYSAFFRWSSYLSGIVAVLFAAALYRRLPRGRGAVAGCAALAAYGLAGAVDAIVPMDCAPSASVVCLRAQQQDLASYLFQAHTWFDVVGTLAALASLWLLGRHLRGRPGWRVAAVAGQAGFALLIVETAVLTAMSIGYDPGVGIVQRIHVLAVSAWLVLLAVVQARRPVSRAAGPGGRPPRGTMSGRTGPVHGGGA